MTGKNEINILTEVSNKIRINFFVTRNFNVENITKKNIILMQLNSPLSNNLVKGGAGVGFRFFVFAKTHLF